MTLHESKGMDMSTHSRWVNAAAFLLPALSLGVPSGYSWGVLLLCVAGLATLLSTPRTACPKRYMAWFAWSALLMGAVSASDAWLASSWRWNALDKPVKFGLVVLAMAAVVRSPVRGMVLKWGIWTGATGAGLTAFWQLQFLYMERAWGYTNAIQFGDIALLLGAWSWAWARHETGRSRWFGWLAGLAGLYACVASASRGAWVMLPILGLLLAWPQSKHPDTDTPAASQPPHTRWAAAALTIGLTLSLLWPMIHGRVTEAWREVQQFQTSHETLTSVGQRLAHWQLAYRIGQDKPWLGWGEEGYIQEKQRQVDAGQAPHMLLMFDHAHNDWLELWAKKGLLGVAALLLLLGVPLSSYWHTLRHTRCPQGQCHDLARLTSARCGLMLVVGFFGFGQTQVMFAHNSGTLMYLFMNLLFMSASLSARPASPGCVAPCGGIHTPLHPPSSPPTPLPPCTS